jgi:trehalose 6-phosphate synthase/phosphatase
VDCYDGGSLDERIAAAKCPRFVDETNKLIVCAARRPGRLLQSRAGDALVYRPSQSGFKSSVDYIAETNRVQWVAWPGACVEDCATQEAVRKRLETEHCTCPIFVGRDTQSLFEGFCMDTLWPNLHGIPTDFNEKLRPALLQQQYDAYAYMSQLYVEKVCDVYEEGDMVLVYDYELMLLPAQLRRRFPDVTCGFFLHTPFPSSELFQVRDAHAAMSQRDCPQRDCVLPVDN